MLTDWGLRDPYASICHGVVLNIVPEALIVDITHEIEKYNIRHGALMLWCALPFMPIGAHMAVVDPGVGTQRRPIAIETARGDFLVGPDNGLLIPGAERLGGIMRVHVIDNVQYRLPVLTSTFHGRDLFAPAAAHLALGVPLEAIGPEIDADEPLSNDRLAAGRRPARRARVDCYLSRLVRQPEAHRRDRGPARRDRWTEARRPARGSVRRLTQDADDAVGTHFR